MRAWSKVLPIDSAPSVVTRQDLLIGSLLAELCDLDAESVERVVRLQQSQGLRFGEAALRLKLITPEDLRTALAKQHGLPFAAFHPDGLSSDLIVCRDPAHPRAEQLRALRTQLLIRLSKLRGAAKGGEARALAVVSPGAHEGRSYLAANLAVLFAQLGLHTLLIDADMRSPRQFKIFKIPDRVGLAAVLSGRSGRDSPVPVPAFGPLSVLPAGPAPPNPQELLLRGTLGGFLKLMDLEYDVILIDTPPARENADAQSIAFCAGCALVVARVDHTGIEETAGVVRDLRDAGALVVGTVLNVF